MNDTWELVCTAYEKYRVTNFAITKIWELVAKQYDRKVADEVCWMIEVYDREVEYV